MSSEKEDAEKLREDFFQELRNAMPKKLTPKQEAFLDLPGMISESGHKVAKHGGSTAWLSARGETIHLVMIQTEESQRGQGHASELLQKICSFADSVGVTLSLRAQPKAAKIELKRVALVDWYKRHGFKGDWQHMTRQPQSGESEG